MVGWGACVMGIHKAAFTAPLILSTPLAVALIVIPQSCDIIFHHLQVSSCNIHVYCVFYFLYDNDIAILYLFGIYIYIYMSITISFHVHFDVLQIDCSLPLTHRPEITIPAACLLYISQLLSVGFFLFKTVTIVMPKESQVSNVHVHSVGLHVSK